jgi:integrase
MSSTQYVDIDRTLQNLEDSQIRPENVEAIRDFVNHCAAEGISEVRQARLVSALKSLLNGFAPDGFLLRDASEQGLKQVIAGLNRSDYAESTKHTFRSAVKKFYKVDNGGHEHPEKVQFFSVSASEKSTSVTREDLFTEGELKRLFRSFTSTRDRAFTMVLYESGARPGELLACNIADFTANGKGDFIFLQGLKNTPDRTNQLVRSGRVVREWLAQHPCGGEVGDIEDPSAPLWVKTQQQSCRHCGEIPHNHDDAACEYESDPQDRLNHAGFYRRFKQACQTADIPENKTRPYNLRHTRLTEVATFMGYEQLNKFAGWKPGSDRAKVYVHLNNDDVNEAIRDQYGLNTEDDEEQEVSCSFCGSVNGSQYSECRNCGRPLSLRSKTENEEKQKVLERLAELDEKGLLEKLEKLEQIESGK